MNKIDGSFRITSMLMLAAAVFYLIGLVFGGWQMAIAAIFYLLLAFALPRIGRSLGWVLFIAAFVMALRAMAGIWAPLSVPAWVFLILALINGLITLSLFVALWRNPDRA